MPCAASPPSTFCQDQVTTSSLSQGRSMAKAAEVASQITRPSRSAAMKSALGKRTPEVVPFQASTTSCAESTAARSGSLPYGASSTRASASFSCLTTSVAQVSEKLSNASTSTGRAPSSDHSADLHGAGVGRRARCRAASRPACRAWRASGRSPRPASPSAPWRGGCGRAGRPPAPPGVKPGRLAQGPEEKLGFCGTDGRLCGGEQLPY